MGYRQGWHAVLRQPSSGVCVRQSVFQLSTISQQGHRYLWDKARELNVCLWIDRILTDMNLSDGASRGELEQDRHQFGWEMVQPDVPED